MTVALRLLAAFVIGVALVSCGGPAAPDGGGGSGPDGVIVGTLADAGGVPLVGAQVSLTLAAPVSAARVGEAGVTVSGAAVTTTNARGEFAFDVDQEGTYVLTNLGDTTGALARVAVTRGSDGRLTSEGSVAMTALELGAVTGKVAGKGAGVMAFLSGTSFLALTAADGSFVIGRVPAGSYEAVAGIAGAVGAAVPVTVTAGVAVALSEDLRLGPVVTGVTPEGFVGLTRTPGGSVLPGFEATVITGSGFGPRQGLSRLTYARGDVPTWAIRSWSDTEIVVASEWYTSWDGDVLEFDEFRFSLTTIAGEAITPVTGSGELYATDAWWSWDEATEFASIPTFVEYWSYPGPRVTGVRVAVAASNGVPEDVSGAPITEFLTRPWGDGYGEDVPSLYVRATSWLPVIASFDATVDPMVVSGEPERILVRGGYLEVDSDTYVVGPNTLSGQLLAADGVTAMPDDGGFSLRISSSWESEADVLFEGSLELASDGSWSVELTVTDDLQAEELLLTVLYDGMRVAGRWLYEMPHVLIPTIAEIADESGGFTGLVAALTAADLFSTFADPEQGPFTVFAPTDDAFAALITYFNDAFELELADLDDLIDEVGVAYLFDLLTYHALDSVVDAFMLEEGGTFTTLFGPEPVLEVTVLDSLYVFNDIAMATVTDADIVASNGVIHVIDTVLLPYLPAID